MTLSKARAAVVTAVSAVALIALVPVTAHAAPIGVTAASAAPASPGPAAPPTNVPVSDTQLHTYFGPWSAIDPTNHDHIAVAYAEEAQSLACYLDVSDDAGATWRTVVVVGQGGLEPLPAGGNQCQFPSVVFGPDGTLYYAFSDHTNLPPPATGSNHGHFSMYLLTSTDGGSSFSGPETIDTQPPVSSTTQGGDFIPAMATDPHTGRLYVTWEVQDFSQKPRVLVPPMAAFSTDRGQTFSPPVSLDSTASGGGAFPNPSVAPDGRVYISFDNLHPLGAPTGAKLVQVVSSSDGGQTYSVPVKAISGMDCYSQPHFEPCPAAPLGRIDDIGVNGEAVAGSTPGVVYAATQAQVDSGYRIQFAVSHDYGATWSSPQTIAIPPGLSADSQLFPNLDVAPDGRVDMVYYDFTVPAGMETTYLTSSFDGGGTFSTPRLISDAPSSIAVGAGYGLANGSFGGGRLVGATDDFTFTAWTDTRRGNATNGKNDVYSSTVQHGRSYTPITPTRITDTRAGSGEPNAGVTLGPGGSLFVKAVPTVPSGSSAVALSLTAVNPTQPGFLAVYPADGTPNTTSVLNFAAGGPNCSVPDCVVPNLVVTPVSASGEFVVHNGSPGSVDVVIDVEGYYTTPGAVTSGGGHYYAVPASRVVDTRCGDQPPRLDCSQEPLPPANSTLSALGAGQSAEVAVAGQGGVPATGASAALVQLTVVNTTASSYLTAFPAGASPPNASNVNWVAGQTTSTRAIVPLGAGGRIGVYNNAGSTDVVVDVVGYFSDATAPASGGALFIPVNPVRVIDTRSSGGAPGPGGSVTVPVTGSPGIPAEVNGSITSAALNVTDVNATAASYLTVTPDPLIPPATTSDLNFTVGEIRANADLATLSASGTVSVYHNAGRTDVVVDAFGYFGPPATTG